jgi:uncharacterized protein (DUF2236 family)
VRYPWIVDGTGHEAAAGLRAASAPFFPADAAIRRVHREGVVLLGGGRALLMQVAHPKVAAGVAEHSSFREGKRRRLMRTLKPTLAIVFGSEAQARAAAAGINAAHARVTGPGYRADDPELLFWVLATLIDTALFMHERFLRPLDDDTGAAYYRDMLRAGSLLGVRPEEAPPDLGAFRRYMEQTLSGLEVTDQARDIARDLFSGRGVTALGGIALRQMTAALLPGPLRRAYGFPWTPLHERAARLSIGAARTVLPRLPVLVRGTPWFLLPGRDGGEPR